MTFNRNFALAALALAALEGCPTMTGSINSGRAAAGAIRGFRRGAIDPGCKQGRNSERAERGRVE